MILKEIIQLRKALHSKPSLSNSEYETAELIKEFVCNHQPTEIIEGIGGAGLAIVYDFPNDGKTITIRCELDALPIQESNDIPYKSVYEGISHKCGHDGHMAIVTSLVYWLKNSSLSCGKVVLLYQPAEETGEGAKRVVNDPKFLSLNTDYVFALHNIPKVPLNSILLMDDGFSAEVQSFEVKLIGKECHASEPENGHNPALAISGIVSALENLKITDVDNKDFALVTPIHINMGQKAYGISPAHGELHYTIRTWNGKLLNRLKENIIQSIEQICTQHSLQYEINWFEYFPASINDQTCIHSVRKAAQKNDLTIIEQNHPFKFGEDFGWFSEKYKTAMFGIGSGAGTPDLHHADYDFPDELISTGYQIFKTLISDILNEE